MNMSRGRRSEQGMSLIAMLVIVIMVSGVAAAFFLLSMSERSQTDIIRYRIKAYYEGESAVEQVIGMVRGLAAKYQLPNNPAIVPGAPLSGTTQASAGLTANFEWDVNRGGVWSQAATNLDITTAAAEAQAVNGDPNNFLRLKLSGTVPVGPETFTFTCVNFQNTAGGGVGNTQTQNFYSINVQGRAKLLDTAGMKSSLAKGTQVNITREMQITNSSLLPFFAFFNSDLEFLPGPRFVGNGRIHTNSDLYIAGGTSIDMNTDYIGAVGQMYRHRKDNGSYTQNGGPLTIHQPLPPPATPGALGAGSVSWAQTVESASPSGQANPGWAAAEQSAGLLPTVQNGATGAQQMATPDISSIQPPASSGGTGGNYYEWAKNPSSSGGSVSTGLILSVDTSGNVTALYNNGNGQTDVTSALRSSGALSTGQIADNRQSSTSYVNTTVVDMGKLKKSGYYPSSGVLYATDARNGTPTVSNGALLPPSPPPAVPSGFVFKDGANLSTNVDPNADAINIVSNGPVYVQGDFNAPSGTDTNGAAYTKVNAAVIADAVNLLSNSWNGSKSPGGTPPTASDTTYNFAMITGQVPTDTTTGQYSGGLENLPRFHENWGGVTATYRGSLINLWKSSIATGAWGKANVYSPPNRNWDWDSSFGSSNVKIPGFPKSVTVSRTVFVSDFWGAGGTGSFLAPE